MSPLTQGLNYRSACDSDITDDMFASSEHFVESIRHCTCHLC